MSGALRSSNPVVEVLSIVVFAMVCASAIADKPSPVTIVSPVPVPISGNVGVTGTPTVQIGNTNPVPVSGNVGISGTPTVAIQNSAAAPLYTTDPAAATRAPFKLPMVFPFAAGSLGSDLNRLTVPDGMRIEVESVYCDFAAFNTSLGVSAITGQPVVPAWVVNFCRGLSSSSIEYCHMFIAQGVLFEPARVYRGVVSQNARFTLDAGEELVATVERNYTEGTNKVVYCNLNGYSQTK
jgi:hypothetical protein